MFVHYEINENKKFLEELSLAKAPVFCVYDYYFSNNKFFYFTKYLDNPNIKVLILSLEEFDYGNCFKINSFSDFISNDLNDYLLIKNIYATVYYPKVEILAYESNRELMNLLLYFRDDLKNRINKVFVFPYSSFVSGLLLGIRSEIPKELMEAFNRTGLTHILAISGYNISIIILFVFNVFKFFSRGVRVFLSLLFILFFVVLVGASASVVRAAIMGSISLFALFCGRHYSVILSLLLSVFFMTLLNPLSLIYDVSFHLSVLATLSLIFFADRFKKIFYFVPKKFMMRESLVMTLAAQVLVLPYVYYRFSAFSLLSPLVNLFVLPLIPFLMFCSFVVVFVSYFSFFISLLLSLLPVLLMKIIFSFLRFFSSFDFSYIQFDK